MIFRLCCLIAAGFNYISQPVVDMRKEPNHSSSLVSQTSYAEQVDVLKQQSDWSYIKTSDQYEGWVPTSAYVERSTIYETTTKTTRLAAHIYRDMTTKRNFLMTVPFGTPLTEVDKTDVRWTQIKLPDESLAYIQKGDITPICSVKQKADLVAFSKQFLNLPFTWGGRSSFGYDCSGFVQMLYAQIGIQLERDARLQISNGQLEEICLDQLEPGDLIFFGSSEGVIYHVGMYVGQEEFIHTQPYQNRPWIQVNNLNEYIQDKGYYHVEPRRSIAQQ